MRSERLAPLTGVAFVALVVIGFVVAGEPPDADSPPQEIIDHYLDNRDSVIAGSFIVTAGGLFLIFFANHLRRVLNATREAALSATVLVGASIMALGIAIDTTIILALAEAADDIEPAGVQTLQALWDNDFVPIALGTLVFLVSVGISTIRTGALPKWLGWVALILAVIGFTPIGWLAFLGGGVWILLVSILLAVRGDRTGAAIRPTGA
jgi:hypothetical protein